VRARSGLVAALLTLPALLVATPASAGTSLSSDVVLQTHTVSVGSAAHKDLSTYPAVMHTRGLSAAVSRAVAAAVTGRARSLTRPKGALPHTAATISATVAEADRSYVSVVLTSTYFTDHAAHPYTLVSTLVFSRTTGAVLGPKDLFKDPVAATALLVREVKRNARSALGPAYDATGVDLALEHTAAITNGSFVPRPLGLEVFFDQGDLAADVFGPTTVLVPWKALLPQWKPALPDLGGGVPLPSYGGGQAVVDHALLKAFAAKVVAAGAEGVRGLTGRVPGSYRLVDTRRVLVAVGSSDVEDLYVMTLVPFATPSKPLAVLVALAGDPESPSLDVVDVARGPVGCGQVSSAFIKALREKCPG